MWIFIHIKILKIKKYTANMAVKFPVYTQKNRYVFNITIFWKLVNWLKLHLRYYFNLFALIIVAIPFI